MRTEQLTVVGRINNDGVLGEPQLVELVSGLLCRLWYTAPLVHGRVPVMKLARDGAQSGESQ